MGGGRQLPEQMTRRSTDLAPFSVTVRDYLTSTRGHLDDVITSMRHLVPWATPLLMFERHDVRQLTSSALRRAGVCRPGAEQVKAATWLPPTRRHPSGVAVNR